MEDKKTCDSSPQLTCLSARELKIDLLPPCRVCGGKASGFHYGQNTCEACKGFFMRSIPRTRAYRCLGSGICEIGPNQKRLCSRCRFQKCLSLGMSKTVIKIGRYTHEKRTQNILEAREIKEKELTAPKQRIQELTPSPELQTSMVSRSPPPSLDLDEIVSKLVIAHDKVIKSIFSSDEDIKEKLNMFIEENKLRLEVFGPRATLSQDQYDEIYRITGIDIDDRQDLMRLVLEQLEKGVRDLVAFVKNIPEFAWLSIVDQANLVKSGTNEFILLETFRGMSSEHQVLTLPNGICFRWDELYKIWNFDFIKTWIDTAISLRRLNLEHKEVVMMEAICVLFADRCELQEREKVEKIQWKLIQGLMHLLEKNHTGDKILFARVIDRITAMRAVSEGAYKIVPTTRKWPGVEKCPLLLEVFDE